MQLDFNMFLILDKQFQNTSNSFLKKNFIYLSTKIFGTKAEIKVRVEILIEIGAIISKTGF